MAEAPSSSTLEESIRSAGTSIITFDGPTERPKLHSTLDSALKNAKLYDVTLVAKGGDIRAHRLILYSQCNNLADELCSDSKEIKLDLDVNALRHLVTYVYLNTVGIPKEDLKAVAMAARELGVEELYSRCISAQLASQKVTPDNCLQMWVEASEVNDEEIIKSVKKVALKGFVKLQKSQDFRDLPFNILKDYITHPELNARNDDERLAAVLTWVRAESETRNRKLLPLLKLLPLARMGAWYLDHILLDSLIQALPEAVDQINQILEGVSDEDRHKTDVPATPAPSQPGTERCLVFVGSLIDRKRSNEVKAMKLDGNFEVVSMGSLSATFSGNWLLTNCCVKDSAVFACGLGDTKNEVWKFSLVDGSSTTICRLNTPRYSHAMSAASDGRIYVIGGLAPQDYHPLPSIEAIDVTSNTCKEVAQLQHKASINLACCQVEGGEKIIVCGGRDDQGYHTIQCYNVKSATTTHSIRIPDQSYSIVYGVVHSHDHLIVVSEEYTAVVPMKSVSQGSTQGITLTKHYITPNYRCAVVLSEGNTHLLLLGGVPKSVHKHYTYRARIEDILKDTEAGWEPVNMPWSLGECSMRGGYDTANICIPTK